jgi:hypothetical protein
LLLSSASFPPFNINPLPCDVDDNDNNNDNNNNNDGNDFIR